MALATQYVDNKPHTGRSIRTTSWTTSADFGAMRRLSYYHFTQDGYDPPHTAAESVANVLTGGDLESYVDRRVMSPSNPQLSRLLGVANFNLRTARTPTASDLARGCSCSASTCMRSRTRSGTATDTTSPSGSSWAWVMASMATRRTGPSIHSSGGCRDGARSRPSGMCSGRSRRISGPSRGSGGVSDSV